MTNTVAYRGLLELISVFGSFVTSHIWFGLSVIQLLVICYCIHYVIGICLGGAEHRAPLEKVFASRYKGVKEVHVGKYDRIANHVKESYQGGGRY